MLVIKTLQKNVIACKYFILEKIIYAKHVEFTYFKGRNFCERNFLDFVIFFCQNRESLFLFEIQISEFTKIYSKNEYVFDIFLKTNLKIRQFYLHFLRNKNSINSMRKSFFPRKILKWQFAKLFFAKVSCLVILS